MSKILSFYDTLVTGMSTNQEEFPIIAYRNYLKDLAYTPHTTLDEVSRCQYALKKYLTKSCVRKSYVPKKLFWPLPFGDDEDEENTTCEQLKMHTMKDRESEENKTNEQVLHQRSGRSAGEAGCGSGSGRGAERLPVSL